MSDVINSILDEIKVLNEQTYKNMTVIGLNVPNGDLDLMSLEIGLDMGLVEITELNEEGSVNEVKVINNAVTPLLLLDGEEIIGSKQNRIVNTTIIIPAKSEKIIPVSCTEKGRWHYKSSKFHYSNHMATSRVRRDKQISVNQSLRNDNSFRSKQSEVWDNIALTEDNLKVNSKSSALYDSYVQRGSDIDEYKSKFRLDENQNGIIVYINGELVGFEIIYNSKRYGEYHSKLLESYIIDAIGKENEESVMGDLNKDELFNKIKESERESYDSVGLGVDYRLEDEEFTGSVMIYDDNLVNASFFRKV